MVPDVSKTERLRQRIAINSFAEAKTPTFSEVTWLLPAIEGMAEKKIFF